MDEKKKIGLEEFSEVEMKEEKDEQRKREWERMDAIKLYRIGEVEGGFLYENQRGMKRVLVKAFEKYAYVIFEKVRE